jgi:SSS family solute:Na+ symporter
VAGLLAALMSSLSSVFNSCSTLVTWDVYKKLNPDASERRLVWVGRVATAALVVLGLLWIPLLSVVGQGTLYTYLQSVQAYISPPIAAVFLLGIAWSRLNAPGAIASLGTGFVLGMFRLILEIMNGADADGLGEGTLAYIAEINFLHFAVLLFVICVVVLIGVSLATAPPSRQKIAGLTYATANDDMGHADDKAPTTDSMEPPPDRSGWRRLDLWLTLGLFVLVGLLWLFFS